METMKPLYLFLVAFIVIVLGVVVIQQSASNAELIDIGSLNLSQNLLLDNGTSSTLTQTPLSLTTVRKNRTHLNFDGVDSNISLVHNTAFNFNDTNFTLCSWIYPRKNATTYNLISKGDLTTEDGFILSIGSGTGVANLTIGNSTLLASAVSTNPTWNGTWTHLCASYAYNGSGGSNITFYVNATQVLSTHIMLGMNNSNVPLEIGNYKGVNNVFNGSIDEVRIYNKALDLVNITQIYNSNTFTHFPNNSLISEGLVLWYGFNENTGSVAYDLAESYNGTITSGDWEDDNINITLIADTDYTLSGAIFTIINKDLAWVMTTNDYNYRIDKNTTASTIAHLIEIFVALSMLTILFLIINHYLKEYY